MLPINADGKHIRTKRRSTARENAMSSGFLVVCEPRLSPNSGKLYAGVGRVPSYPSDNPAEQDAMDEYVFGGIKDLETNLVPSLKTSRRLWAKLGRGGRRFEIIYCSDERQPTPCSELDKETTEHLGYDVAAVSTECWSIVDDIALAGWAIPYQHRLNEYGLFPTSDDADAYLRDYRAYGEWDADFPFDIVEVIRIKLDGQSC